MVFDLPTVVEQHVVVEPCLRGLIVRRLGSRFVESQDLIVESMVLLGGRAASWNPWGCCWAGALHRVILPAALLKSITLCDKITAIRDDPSLADSELCSHREVFEVLVDEKVLAWRRRSV
jgi:hypothetical protein